MNASSKDGLLRYGDLVQRLEVFASLVEHKSGSELRSILQEMSDLLADALGVVPPTDTDADEHQLSDDVELLQQQIESLRLRMVGVLLADHSRPPESMESCVDMKVGTLITTQSGMTYSKVDDQCIILLPAFSDSTSIDAFGSEMIEVYDMAMTCRGIVFDCSAVRTLPNIVQALLLGYRHNFDTLGIAFSIVWLHRQAIHPSSVEQVAKAFSAQQIGEYLFAR